MAADGDEELDETPDWIAVLRPADHSFSTSAAHTISPRIFAALISAMLACAAASRPRSAVAFASGAALAFFLGRAHGVSSFLLIVLKPACELHATYFTLVAREDAR